MTNTEMFHNKNPRALDVHCDLAAKLYEVLLKQDAFENGVQVKNFYASFSFHFPNGKIEIASVITFCEPVPCYITHKNGTSPDLIHFTIGQLSSWLQNNWDDLIAGEKK